MKVYRSYTQLTVGFILLASISLFFPKSATAHCDTMDGPVVKAAEIALAKGDVTPVLKWVQKDDEEEMQRAFNRTLAVRKTSPEARELADLYFFETLVRIHRAGEGEPYTGIKDEPVEPIVAMSDKGITYGSADELIKNLSSHIAEAIREKLNKVVEAEKNMNKSVDAGREYVESYVIYTHYVESIHTAIMSAARHHHEADAEGGGKHK